MGLQLKIDDSWAAPYEIPEFLWDGLRIEVTDDICTLAFCKRNEKYCLFDVESVTPVLKYSVFWTLNLIFLSF